MNYFNQCELDTEEYNYCTIRQYADVVVRVHRSKQACINFLKKHKAKDYIPASIKKGVTAGFYPYTFNNYVKDLSSWEMCEIEERIHSHV